MTIGSTRCRIDHNADGAIPRVLCRTCNPRPVTQTFVAQEVRDKEDERVAKLEDGFREYFLAECKAGRANMHWLDEPGVIEYMRSAYNRSRIARAERNEGERPPRKERTPKAERPHDTFTLAQLAQEHKAHPRIYRAAARNIKKALEPLQVNGLKYVYRNGDKTHVLSFIQQELERQCRQKSLPKKSSKKSSAKQTEPPSRANKTATKKSSKKKDASSRKVSRSKSLSTSSANGTRKKRR